MNNNVDEKKIKNIMRRILNKEKDNLATKKYTQTEMKTEIKKIIKNCVNSKYE